jgi:hypothetical protein
VQGKLKEMNIANGKAWQDAKDGAQSTVDDCRKPSKRPVRGSAIQRNKAKMMG